MENATIGKNLILFTQIYSGQAVFAASAATGSIVSANVSAPSNPVHLYMISVYNPATATTMTLKVNNSRTIGSASRNFELTNITYTTGQTKDSLIEGIFAGAATGLNLEFSNVTALSTAGTAFTAEYQIWAVR